MRNLIIFDLDGVITSEEAYWDSAGLTLHELLYSPQYWNVSAETRYQPAASAQESREISRGVLPMWLILSFKARALNSNWDTCYAAVCLHLLDWLTRLPDRTPLLPLEPASASWMATLRALIAQTPLARSQKQENEQVHHQWREQHPFDLPVFHNATGLTLFEHMDAYASALLHVPVEGVFARSKPFWRFCRQLFQEWLLGDTLYAQTYGHPPAWQGKPGCIFFEEPLLPIQAVRETLETLIRAGYTLGIASGRGYQEAAQPLGQYDLLRYFDERHLGTYDLVTRGEKVLRARGSSLMLGKPHPFHFQAAVDWQQALRNVSEGVVAGLDIPFIVVGDSTSDILGGQRAGALTVAVLTGARSPEARDLLLNSGPDVVIEDVTRLPAVLEQFDSLHRIQQLQFTRREFAEQLLRLWFARHMDLPTQRVRLRPRAVSLNSFNGFYQQDGQEFFFKTHVEAHGVLDEYYHAQVLETVGYNVVRPCQVVGAQERQMVIYPVVTWPVLFDLLRALETGQQPPDGLTDEVLLATDRRECAQLLSIYRTTFQAQHTPETLPPIHQLFWHRLNGERFQAFYAGQALPLPGARQPAALPFADLLRSRWVINGHEQPCSLGELVQRAREVLHPARAMATVVGHGDAHAGNVFLAREHTQAPDALYRYLYFDPAFAGRHTPLLDIVKPLYHNVLATWMYFPAEVACALHLAVQVQGERIIIEHNYRLSPIRQALLNTRCEALLGPLVAWLEEHHALPAAWQDFLHLALMCCPLLTINLCDETKIPPTIAWLGLAQAVHLGNAGLAPWREM